MQTDTNNFADSNSTPSPDAAQDLYEVLQVSPRAEQAVIEAAFRRLAQLYHPDRNPDPSAVVRMQSLNAAYAVLRDPLKRAEYDRERANPPAPEAETVSYYDGYDWNDPPFQPIRRPFPVQKWLIVSTIIVILLLAVSLLFGGKDTAPSTQASPFVTTAPAEGSKNPNLIFSDDFDTVGPANWLLDSPWHLTNRLAFSGKYSLWIGDEAQGNYATNLNAAATLVRPLDLVNARAPMLVFQLRGQNDNPAQPARQDFLMVELAEPGQAYQNIYTFSGLNANWETVRVDLNQWKGKTIILRFRFQSSSANAGTSYSGTFIDDMQIVRE